MLKSRLGALALAAALVVNLAYQAASLRAGFAWPAKRGEAVLSPSSGGPAAALQRARTARRRLSPDFMVSAAPSRSALIAPPASPFLLEEKSEPWIPGHLACPDHPPA